VTRRVVQKGVFIAFLFIAPLIHSDCSLVCIHPAVALPSSNVSRRERNRNRKGGRDEKEEGDLSQDA
jgi:hypothetical protein